MEFRDYLDLFIEEALGDMLEPDQISYCLLSEDFSFITPEGAIPLEEMHRKYRSVGQGRRVLVAVQGRIDPKRARKAKLAAVKGRAKRRMAQRRSTTKMKRARTMQTRRRMGIKTRGVRPATRRPSVRRPPKPRPSGRRGAHGAKRHAGPRTHKSYRRR